MILLVLASGMIAQSSLAARVDARAESMNALLSRFEKEPRSILSDAPPYVDAEPPESPRFSLEAIESGKAITARDQERSRLCMDKHGERKCLGASSGTRAEIQGDDRPEALADNGAKGFLWKLEELETRGLKHAFLPNQPWSDDYWGHYKGIVGARYADPGFPGAHPDLAIGFDWKSNDQYVRTYPADRIARHGSDAQVDLLSPSEKYELLIGDKLFSLTEKMWRRGQRYYESDGKVDLWMGICHGWAPAAMMLPRPSRSIRLQSADGAHVLRFYPSDIKALADLLWAEGEFNSRFIGGRCHDVNPKTDENGRILRQQCFDTNPGTWHLAVANQIGISRRSLIMDAAYDYRIWNQPVLGYAYHYFNPQSMKYVHNLADARVPMSEFSNDKFRRYRSAKTKAVVGIIMDLTYVASTRPSHAHEDSPEQDHLRTIRYLYDLELDSEGKIIGGEWYMNQHPDFLWVPEPSAQPQSEYESQASGTWNATAILPVSWQSAARNASEDGQPLTKIVEALVSKASSLSSPE